jgi:hypothetical protein
MLVDESEGTGANPIGKRMRADPGIMLKVNMTPRAENTYTSTTYDVFFSIVH